MKNVSRILMTIMLLFIFSNMTMAQVASTATPGNPATKNATVAPGKFTDANKNGVCDNHEAKVTGGQGKNFVDKNGDGKCDNCKSSGKCNGSGCGKGQQHGQCNGKGNGNGTGCGKGPHGYGCAGPCGRANNQPLK